ncbi:hypothetical protein ABZ920_00290 [Streptomyces sp. NPDC046831]|uniref:hypothetical protein n=1 Tax=Streptomyces sp. NPDC046831 TaxID=3154805 RepID=UPI0033F7CED9
MKTTPLRCLQRSLACSAAATVVSLAAVLASASVAAADAASPPDREGQVQNCDAKPARQGFDALLWAIVPRPAEPAARHAHCTSQSDDVQPGGREADGDEPGDRQGEDAEPGDRG